MLLFYSNKLDARIFLVEIETKVHHQMCYSYRFSCLFVGCLFCDFKLTVYSIDQESNKLQDLKWLPNFDSNLVLKL